jgi:biotin carboxylase
MNLVYLSPNFPPNYYQFSLGLMDLGVTVLGIGDAPYEQLSNELKYALTEYYKVDSLESYDQLLRAVAFFTHKYGKIDRICSHNEYWLEKEAMLRTDFNVQGIKSDEIYTIKCKSKMKQKFIEAGVNVAEGKIVHSIAQSKAFIKKVGYPVIAKPDNGVGAISTFKIHDDDELEDFFNNKGNYEYIMEEYIDGDLYSFDGLTDRDGKPVFYTSHLFNTGVMQSVNQGQDFYYYSLREIPKDLEIAGLSTLKAFKTKESFFHIEFFRRKKDSKIVALEVNMRPPGGLTTDMFNFANDINIYQEWANIVVNNKFTASYYRKYHCCYIGRKYINRYIHSRDEIMAKYGEFIVMESDIPDVASAAIGNYAFLARSQDLNKIKEITTYILE